MARPLRLEFPGALYHLTARGNARARIYLDESDRNDFLERGARELACQARRAALRALAKRSL